MRSRSLLSCDAPAVLQSLDPVLLESRSPATHRPITDTKNIGRLNPRELPSRRLQNHFLELHGPLLGRRRGRHA